MKLRRLECYDEQLSHIGGIEDKIVEVIDFFDFILKIFKRSRILVLRNA